MFYQYPGGSWWVTKTLCTPNEANAFSLWNNNLGYQAILEYEIKTAVIGKNAHYVGWKGSVSQWKQKKKYSDPLEYDLFLISRNLCFRPITNQEHPTTSHHTGAAQTQPRPQGRRTTCLDHACKRSGKDNAKPWSFHNVFNFSENSPMKGVI
jgi:hypothetical protein